MLKRIYIIVTFSIACICDGLQVHQRKETRRAFLERSATGGGLLTSSLIFLPVLPNVCQAAAETSKPVAGKPYAPVSALLPATRLKLWIDRAHGISAQLKTTINSPDEVDKQTWLLKELNDVLSNRPSLFLKGEKPLKRTNSFSAQLTTAVSPANKEQWQQNRKSLSNPIDGMTAMWNQADVERQWGMLQTAEAQREQSNQVRAALNYYTQQLEFGDSYQLTASKEDRKRMIRNDELPTLTAVITSDLDLRDLYRNQLLTALDDAIAETNYQFKEQQAMHSVDVGDVIDLMEQTFVSSSKWFALIDPEDLQEAINIAKSE